MIVLRGGCSFGSKAINAHEAGAQGVIVESDRPGPPFVVEEEADLPLLVVTDAVGRELRAYIARAGSAARVRFTRTIEEVPTPPRVLTDFSSAGPTPFDLLLKPDIAAPGEAILSSVPRASSDYPGAFASWAGTSMAAPAVTGVVALMRERHPAWTPAQIRAALIDSAVRPTPTRTRRSRPRPCGRAEASSMRPARSRPACSPIRRCSPSVSCRLGRRRPCP